MTGRRTIAGLGLAVMIAAALTPVPASAHHTGPEYCVQEVGIWTKSNRARSGLTTREQMADVRLQTPPAETCKMNWQSSWWKRTSTDYNVLPFPKQGDAEHSAGTVDYASFSVDGQTDYINSRTTGKLVPPSMESVNLYVTTSGGVRVWFNGNLVIDEWHDVASSTMYWYPTPVLSPSMEYPVAIEHYHKTGPQKLQLHWKTASTDIVMPQSYSLNGSASQASAIHATDASGGNCTETVAVRSSGGALNIWGYGCELRPEDETDGDLEIMTVDDYQAQWITLWQKWNGTTNPSTWGHWFYRWDTKEWVYVGSTGPRPADLQGWLESSGYNPGSRRETAFDNYKEGGTLVDVSVCPETTDLDTHQEMDPAYFPTGGKFYPATSNTC